MQIHEVSKAPHTEGEVLHPLVPAYDAIAKYQGFIEQIKGLSVSHQTADISEQIQNRTQGFLGRSVSRRTLLKGLGGGIVLAAASYGRGDFLRSAEAAIVREPDCGLPVASRERDERTTGTKEGLIRPSAGLKSKSRSIQITDIGFNPTLKDYVPSNRRDIFLLNGAVREAQMGALLGPDRDTSRIQAFLSSGSIPENPNWPAEFLKIQSDEPYTRPMMALPMEADQEMRNLDWFDVDVKQSSEIVYVAKEGLISNSSWKDAEGNWRQAEGFTLRFDPKTRRLRYEIYSDDLMMKNLIAQTPNVDHQRLLEFGLAQLMKEIITFSSMTLGAVVDPTSGENLYNNFFIPNYSVEQLTAGLFPELQALAVGANPDFSDRLLSVKYNIPQ